MSSRLSSGSPRARTVVLLAVLAAIIVAGASIALYNRVNFGTFYTAGAPPRIQYCGRRYYPPEPPRTVSLAHVTAFLAANGVTGLTRVGTTPSGLPIVANVVSADMKQSHSTAL